MRSKVEIDSDKKTNYSFLLKCMAGLTAAAFVTAGALAIGAACAGAGLAATALAGPFGLAAAIVGAVAVVAALCLIPCFFSRNRTTSVVCPTGGSHTIFSSQRSSMATMHTHNSRVIGTTRRVEHHGHAHASRVTNNHEHASAAVARASRANPHVSLAAARPTLFHAPACAHNAAAAPRPAVTVRFAHGA